MQARPRAMEARRHHGNAYIVSGLALCTFIVLCTAAGNSWLAGGSWIPRAKNYTSSPYHPIIILTEHLRLLRGHNAWPELANRSQSKTKRLQEELKTSESLVLPKLVLKPSNRCHALTRDCSSTVEGQAALTTT